MISEFKRRFLAAASQRLAEEDVIPKVYLDAKVHFKELTFDFMESFSLLEPFGNENPPPILYNDVVQTWTPKVIGKFHLKFFLEEGERPLEGIGFNMAGRREQLRQKNAKLQIAFTPIVNMFLNKASIQLQIKDFKIFPEKPNS